LVGDWKGAVSHIFDWMVVEPGLDLIGVQKKADFNFSYCCLYKTLVFLLVKVSNTLSLNDIGNVKGSYWGRLAHENLGCLERL
jgi:hypothetical protein